MRTHSDAESWHADDPEPEVDQVPLEVPEVPIPPPEPVNEDTLEITQNSGSKENEPKLPPPDKFPCRLCSATYQFERGLVMHFKRQHPGLKPLICPECGIAVADKLKEHLKTHGIGEEFVCELCGRRFNQKFMSKIHELWHEGEISSFISLVGHKTIRVGRRPNGKYCLRWNSNSDLSQSGESAY